MWNGDRDTNESGDCFKKASSWLRNEKKMKRGRRNSDDSIKRQRGIQQQQRNSIYNNSNMISNSSNRKAELTQKLYEWTKWKGRLSQLANIGFSEWLFVKTGCLHEITQENRNPNTQAHALCIMCVLKATNRSLRSLMDAKATPRDTATLRVLKSTCHTNDYRLFRVQTRGNKRI